MNVPNSPETPWKSARFHTNLGVMITAGLGAVGLTLTFLTVVALVFLGSLDLEASAAMVAFIGPATFITGVLCAWMCLRKERNKEDAARACLTAGLFGGMVNTVFGYLSLCFTILVASGSPAEFVQEIDAFVVGVIVATLIGVIVGSPIGLILSLFFLKPIRLACSHQRSHDSVEHTWKVCGAWFALCGVGCGAMILFASLCGTANEIEGVVIPFAWSAFSGVLGLVFYVFAKVRGARRREWLERVRYGQVEGWSVLPLNDQLESMAQGLRPFIYTDDAAAVGILARIGAGHGPGAYREAEHLVPVATVSAP